MNTRFGLFIAILILPLFAHAQMWNGQDTLYGNEWINYEQEYFKIEVAEDGIYRISASTLSDAGIPLSSIEHQYFQLFHLGQEQPIYIESSLDQLSPEGFIEFYGQKNRSELDRYLYLRPDEEMLNPYYSMFTDTSAYFLTWTTDQAGLRYEDVENELVDLPEEEEWFWETKTLVFNNQFSIHKYPDYIEQSLFEDGEGYGTEFLNEQNFTLDLPSYLTDIDSISIKTHLLSTYSINDRTLVIDLDGDVIYSEVMPIGYANFRQIEQKVLPQSEENLSLTIKGLGAVNDKYSIGFIQYRYPRSYSFSDFEGYQPFKINSFGSDQYLNIDELGSADNSFALYDHTNKLRIEAESNNGILDIKLPPGQVGSRSLDLVDINSIKEITSVNSIAFEDYSNYNSDFVIITSNQLMSTPESNNSINEYAEYRRSIAGGAHDVKILTVEDLYLHFSYGIERHPQSIRNFGHYINKNWPKANFLLIIGKGRTFDVLRTPEQLTEAIENGFHVPTFGYPGSDMLLTATPFYSVPLLATGRIPATTPEEIDIYFNKVQHQESFDVEQIPQTIEDKGWRKNIIHLGGGGDPAEQNYIKNNLTYLENIIKAPKVGAEVYSFFKNSTENVQTTTNDLIFQKINEGASIITFFGHSAPGTFDFNIDNPENYNNAGKLPLLISLGCYSGNMHLNGKSIGERFIFYENKGALTFLGSSGQGYIHALKGYAGQFYTLLSDEYYDRSIGETLRQVHDDLKGSSYNTQLLLQQFNLIGDPSIHLNPLPGPDYVIDKTSVTITPEVINAQTDSIQLNFDLVNIGRAIDDSLSLTIKQQLPDGQIRDLKNLRLTTPFSKDEIEVKVNNIGKEAVGLNRLLINVDTNDEVEELPNPAAELNNDLTDYSGQVGFPMYIVDNSARCVYPPDFGIVSQSPFTLSASTTDALAPERTYILELDTTELFNSPIKTTTNIRQSGGLIKWQPDIIPLDSTVYYWRISPDSTETGVGYIWDNNSFTYIEGSPNGWSQGHYWQWLKDELTDISVTHEGFEFRDNGVFNGIRNKIYNEDDQPAFIWNLETSAVSIRPWDMIETGIAVVVADPTTGVIWENPSGGLYGSTTPRWSRVFPFLTETPEQRNNIMNFLTTVIPDDHYVYVFSILTDETNGFQPEEWEHDSTIYGQNLFQVLESEGAELIRELEHLGSLPYTFMYQKNKGKLSESIGADINDIIFDQIYIPLKKTNGSFNTALIGPASSWDKAIINIDNNTIEADDIHSISIYGKTTTTSHDSLLMEGIQISNIDLGNINANTFPYLFLTFNFEDAEMRTPPHLKRASVIYDGIPELGFTSNQFHFFHSDTLQQGDSLKLVSTIENISNYESDSLELDFVITNSDNQTESYNLPISNLGAGTSKTYHFASSTINLSGDCSISAKINYLDGQNDLRDFNNHLHKPFHVIKDEYNPLLDVTFDGRHILENDIISPNTIIKASLKDENNFLLLNDTTHLNIYIQEPNDNYFQKIVFSDPDISYSPANLSENNQFEVTIKRNFDHSGHYTLKIKGQDRSGNLSGTVDYQKTFQVIQEESISQVLNYPNPFSSSTKFVYTLTGDSPPDSYQINIYSASGRKVKHLSEVDLGPLEIGTHKTLYAWDGRDDYGDKLANGTYFYEFILPESSNDEFEVYESDIDRFFKNGIGKLVILR